MKSLITICLLTILSSCASTNKCEKHEFQDEDLETLLIETGEESEKSVKKFLKNLNAVRTERC